MKLSCCIWALDEGTGPFRLWRRFGRQRVNLSQSLEQLAALGFRYVDICPSMLRDPDTRAQLNRLELKVNCISASHEAPTKSTFDSDSPKFLDPMVSHVNGAISHASNLEADFSYVVPGPPINDKSHLHHAKHYAKLAERGEEQGLKIGIEHFPGTILPTVSATLDFIREIGHPNLYLLFDLGHAQISKEDPAEVLPLAGDRLAYIHLDDNDGERDLHLPLTDGIQTEESLERFFNTLEDIHYDGALSLEMMPTLRDPLDAIRRGKAIVERFVDFK